MSAKVSVSKTFAYFSGAYFSGTKVSVSNAKVSIAFKVRIAMLNSKPFANFSTTTGNKLKFRSKFLHF